jgi:hypothetical protein
MADLGLTADATARYLADATSDHQRESDERLSGNATARSSSARARSRAAAPAPIASSPRSAAPTIGSLGDTDGWLVVFQTRGRDIDHRYISTSRIGTFVPLV